MTDNNGLFGRFDDDFYTSMVKACTRLAARLQEIEDRLNEIDHLGYTCATIIWREGYRDKLNMYLYHPNDEGWVSPKGTQTNYEYVGARQERQEEAMARISRYEEKQRLERERRETRHKLETVKYNLASIERVLFGRQEGF